MQNVCFVYVLLSIYAWRHAECVRFVYDLSFLCMPVLRLCLTMLDLCVEWKYSVVLFCFSFEWSLCIYLVQGLFYTLQIISMVEQCAVNAKTNGSSPLSGASSVLCMLKNRRQVLGGRGLCSIVSIGNLTVTRGKCRKVYVCCV